MPILAKLPAHGSQLPPVGVPDFPKIFGWQHIVYLLICIAVSVATLVFIKLKVKNERTQNIIVKCMGGLLLAVLIINRITYIIHYDDIKWLIPNSFCGVTSFLFGLSALFLKRDSLPFHYCIYAGFWGGLIVSIYPTFLNWHHSFMYPATVTGMLHHTMSLYLAILLVMTGYVKPCLKKYYAFPVGFCIIMTFGIFLLDAVHTSEAMYIFQPLVPKTFLTWYTVGPMLVLGSLGLLALYEKVIVPKLVLKKKPAKPVENTN